MKLFSVLCVLLMSSGAFAANGQRQSDNPPQDISAQYNTDVQHDAEIAAAAQKTAEAEAKQEQEKHYQAHVAILKARAAIALQRAGVTQSDIMGVQDAGCENYDNDQSLSGIMHSVTCTEYVKTNTQTCKVTTEDYMQGCWMQAGNCDEHQWHQGDLADCRQP